MLVAALLLGQAGYAQNPSVYNWSNGVFQAATTQAKRYTIGRVYYNAAHWGYYSTLKLTLTNHYFRGGRAEYLITSAGGSVELDCTSSFGSTANVRMVLGDQTNSGTTYSGQVNYYRDIYLDVDYWSHWFVRAEAYNQFALDQNSITSETVECGITTLFSSPASQNITSFYPDIKPIALGTGDTYLKHSLGIGTTDLRGYQLAVKGRILAQEIRVEASSWPDYVFAEGYRAEKLEDLESFIKSQQTPAGYPVGKRSGKRRDQPGRNECQAAAEDRGADTVHH